MSERQTGRTKISAIDLSKMTEKDRRRFYSKIDAETRKDADACWQWLGSHKKRGYGRFWLQGHVVAAHRVSYFLEYGALDDHLVLDHLCRYRDCVNPRHLEAVCPVLNQQRRIEWHRRERNRPDRLTP
jgi:hypothetical protein